jgi:hypothetical protein
MLPARGRGPVANTASPAQAGGLDARVLQSRSPRPVGRRWRGDLSMSTSVEMEVRVRVCTTLTLSHHLTRH